jgi:hypothetical protein
VSHRDGNGDAFSLGEPVVARVGARSDRFCASAEAQITGNYIETRSADIRDLIEAMRLCGLLFSGRNLLAP